MRGIGEEFGFSLEADPTGIEYDAYGSPIPTSPQTSPQTATQSSTAPESNEQLIIFDDEQTTATTETRKPLSEYCQIPNNLCFDDPVFAETFRNAMRGGCEKYPRDSLVGQRKMQAKGLGLVDCGLPMTTVITPKNAAVFYETYGPCQLKDVQDCEPPPFLPCKLGQGACIDSRYLDILETAETQCQFGVTPPHDDRVCPAPNGVITPRSAHRYNPCELAQVPMCGELSMDIPLEDYLTITPQAEFADEPEDDSGKYIVGGLLGLLALGGIAYAVTRKKKRKK